MKESPQGAGVCSLSRNLGVTLSVKEEGGGNSFPPCCPHPDLPGSAHAGGSVSVSVWLTLPSCCHMPSLRIYGEVLVRGRVWGDGSVEASRDRNEIGWSS